MIHILHNLIAARDITKLYSQGLIAIINECSEYLIGIPKFLVNDNLMIYVIHSNKILSNFKSNTDITIDEYGTTTLNNSYIYTLRAIKWYSNHIEFYIGNTIYSKLMKSLIPQFEFSIINLINLYLNMRISIIATYFNCLNLMKNYEKFHMEK